MQFDHIDHGNEFDFGKTSKDYSKYRDIYPDSLYRKLYNAGIGLKDQKVLDLGTGTGVFPRGMYQYGAEFYGIDVSNNQIVEAQKLAQQNKMNISFSTCSAENINFSNQYFDSITAIQCFLYFNKDIVLPKINDLLKSKGLFATVWMAWIPEQSEIAAKTEELILKYNPKWQGCNYKPQKSEDSEWSKQYFNVKTIENYFEDIEFSVDTWLGRIRACRGVSAALNESQVAQFNDEHKSLLQSYKQPTFKIPHQILIHVYEKKAFDL